LQQFFFLSIPKLSSGHNAQEVLLMEAGDFIAMEAWSIIENKTIETLRKFLYHK
jgi:hypothetical protein